MTEPPRIRVLCIDDNADIAAAVRLMVNSEPDMTSVGERSAADDLLDAVKGTRPDVVLLDLTMPGKNPLEALRELTAAHPSVRAIVFSGYDDADRVERSVEAGAWGYLSKSAEPAEVITAIRRVASGGLVLPGR